MTAYQESLPQNNTKYIKKCFVFQSKGTKLKSRYMCQTQSSEYISCLHGKIINLFSVAHKVWISPVHDDISLCDLEDYSDKNFENYFCCRYWTAQYIASTICSLFIPFICFFCCQTHCGKQHNCWLGQELCTICVIVLQVRRIPHVCHFSSHTQFLAQFFSRQISLHL